MVVAKEAASISLQAANDSLVEKTTALEEALTAQAIPATTGVTGNVNGDTSIPRLLTVWGKQIPIQRAMGLKDDDQSYKHIQVCDHLHYFLTSTRTSRPVHCCICHI